MPSNGATKTQTSTTTQVGATTVVAETTTIENENILHEDENLSYSTDFGTYTSEQTFHNTATETPGNTATRSNWSYEAYPPGETYEQYGGSGTTTNEQHFTATTQFRVDFPGIDGVANDTITETANGHNIVYHTNVNGLNDVFHLNNYNDPADPDFLL